MFLVVLICVSELIAKEKQTKVLEAEKIAALEAIEVKEMEDILLNS